jgi:hypothetical protein
VGSQAELELTCSEQDFEEICMTNGLAMHILWLTRMGASPLDSKTRQDLHDQDEIEAYTKYTYIMLNDNKS